MGQRGDTFVLSLQLDVPPNDLLTITYSLTGTPVVNQETFPWVKDAYGVAWLYDEIELVGEAGQKQFVQSILLSNGWQIRLSFRDVQTTTAFPLLPHPRAGRMGGTPMPAIQSA